MRLQITCHFFKAISLQSLVWTNLKLILFNIGSTLIFFFARRVLEWGKDKPVIGGFFTFCLEKGHKGGEKLKEKAGNGLYVALFLFVGIPLPGTGAWTGTLAASILDMDFKKSVKATMAGVVLAGVIMGLGTKIIMIIASLF